MVDAHSTVECGENEVAGRILTLTQDLQYAEPGSSAVRLGVYATPIASLQCLQAYMCGNPQPVPCRIQLLNITYSPAMAHVKGLKIPIGFSDAGTKRQYLGT